MIIRNFKLFSSILQFNEILNAVPCRWNTTFLKLDCVECPKRNRRRLYSLLLHLVALLIFCWQNMYNFGTKPEYLHLSRAELFLYRVGLLINIASHFTLHVCNVKADSICAYVNSLIDFQRRHNHLYNRNNQATILTDRFSLLIVYGLVAAGFIIPLAFPTVIHWFNVCRPSLLGYWLIPECNPSLKKIVSVGIVFKLVVMSFNVWMWLFCLINTAILVGTLLYTMCVVTTRKNIEL